MIAFQKNSKARFTQMKSAQTSAPKTALVETFEYEIFYFYLINSLASTVFCTDYTSVNPAL